MGLLLPSCIHVPRNHNTQYTIYAAYIYLAQNMSDVPYILNRSHITDLCQILTGTLNNFRGPSII